MKTKTYTGPLTHLHGKTAQILPRTNGMVLAQFDDRTITRSGKPLNRARFATEEPTPPADALGYGWHSFNATDFT